MGTRTEALRKVTQPRAEKPAVQKPRGGNCVFFPEKARPGVLHRPARPLHKRGQAARAKSLTTPAADSFEERRPNHEKNKNARGRTHHTPALHTSSLEPGRRAIERRRAGLRCGDRLQG